MFPISCKNSSDKGLSRSSASSGERGQMGLSVSTMLTGSGHAGHRAPICDDNVLFLTFTCHKSQFHGEDGALNFSLGHGRFSRSTGVAGLSDPRISLSGPQVTSPLRSLRVSGNAHRWVTPKRTESWEGRAPMSPPVGPPLQGTTRGPSVAPIQGLRKAPGPTTSCEHQSSEPAFSTPEDPK